MNEVIIELVAQIVGTFLLMLIGVAGTYLTTKIAKRNELATIAAATAEATDTAQRVVLELQQTLVEGIFQSTLPVGGATGTPSPICLVRMNGLSIRLGLPRTTRRWRSA